MRGRSIRSRATNLRPPHRRHPCALVARGVVSEASRFLLHGNRDKSLPLAAPTSALRGALSFAFTRLHSFREPRKDVVSAPRTVRLWFQAAIAHPSRRRLPWRSPTDHHPQPGRGSHICPPSHCCQLPAALVPPTPMLGHLFRCAPLRVRSDPGCPAPARFLGFRLLRVDGYLQVGFHPALYVARQRTAIRVLQSCNGHPTITTGP